MYEWWPLKKFFPPQNSHSPSLVLFRLHFFFFLLFKPLLDLISVLAYREIKKFCRCEIRKLQLLLLINCDTTFVHLTLHSLHTSFTHWTKLLVLFIISNKHTHIFWCVLVDNLYIWLFLFLMLAFLFSISKNHTLIQISRLKEITVKRNSF